jgi:hypothetical protein
MPVTASGQHLDFFLKQIVYRLKSQGNEHLNQLRFPIYCLGSFRHTLHRFSGDDFYLRFLPSLSYNLFHVLEAPGEVGLMLVTSTVSVS